MSLQIHWRGLVALCLAVISSLPSTSAAITGQGRMQQVALDNLDLYTDSHMRRRLQQGTSCDTANDEESVEEGFFCNIETATNIPCAGESSCCVYSGTCTNAGANNCE
jgi:hypothetical protein